MPNHVLKVSNNFTGKMEGMTVITTAMCNNPNCERLSHIEGAICQQCYSKTALAYRKNVKECYITNGEILSSGIIPTNQIPYINSNFCRLESHGDLFNETHLENYLKVCKKNPQTSFALWTKQYDLVYEYFKTHKAPRNLTLVISSLMMNKQMDIQRYKNLGLKVKVFTVYSKEYLAEHSDVKINCGGRKCIDCLRCYKGKETVINELLKKDQKKGGN